MSMIFGADSSFPSNARLTNGYTLFDWVMRKNCFPAFWGRNILGENSITEEEIEFLKGKNCKVALIINHLSEADVSKTNGDADALEAAEAAKALNIPADGSTALFVDIKDDWTVNHNWMISFANALNDSGYVPGFIGNTDSSKNFNFDRQCGHYMQATKDMDEYGAIYWATEPKTDAEPTVWSPFFPSDFTVYKISIWRTSSVSVNNISANTNYAQDYSVLKYFV